MCANSAASNPSNSRRRFMSRTHCALLGARKAKTLRKKQVADALGDLARWTLSWDTRRTMGCLSGVEAPAKGYTLDQVT